MSSPFVQRVEQDRPMSSGDGDSKGPARLQSRVPVQLRIVFQDVGEVLEAFSTNLGAGGMLLISNREVAEGSRLRLRFKLPGIADEFHTWAEVAWRRTSTSTGFGLRFTDLSEDANQQRISRFVTERWSETGAHRRWWRARRSTVQSGLAGPLSQRGQRILSAQDVLAAERCSMTSPGSASCCSTCCCPPWMACTCCAP